MKERLHWIYKETISLKKWWFAILKFFKKISLKIYKHFEGKDTLAEIK